MFLKYIDSVAQKYKNIKYMQDLNEYVSNMSLTIFEKINKCVEKKYYNSENIGISQCMLQMALDKMLSVHLLLTKKHNISEKIDVCHYQSTYSIVRSLYELLLLHHSIFVNPIRTEETDFLRNLWIVKSLNNRINYGSEKMCENDVVEKKKCKINIEESSIFTNFFNKEEVKRAYESDKHGYFQLNIDGGCYHLRTISFSDRGLFDKVINSSYETQMMYSNKNMIYDYISANSHPTYLSVLQFGQQSSMDEKMFYFPLQITVLLVWCFMNHFDLVVERYGEKDA